MKRTLIFLILLLFIQHCFFIAVIGWCERSSDMHAFPVLAWIIISAFTASTICVAFRRHIHAVVVNGLLTAIIINYLLLTRGYLIPDPVYEVEVTVTDIKIAIVRAIVFWGISVCCGAFVHIIVSRLDTLQVTLAKEKLKVAAWKGFTFSLSCVVVTMPVLLLLWPAYSSVNTVSIALAYSVGGLLTGVLVASVVGIVYTTPQSS